MIIMRYYTVMGQLCVEGTAYDDTDVTPETHSVFLGRSYVPLAGDVGYDDLWFAFNQLANDRCAEGHHDNTNDWV